MTQFPHFPLDDQLCFALYRASMEVGRLYKPLLDLLGITYPQYLVLAVLWENDGLTVGAIAARLALEPSTITPLLKRLEGAGFVERRRNPDNERQVIVRLTRWGRDLKADSTCLGASLVEASGLPQHDLRKLQHQVRALADRLATRPMAQDEPSRP